MPHLLVRPFGGFCALSDLVLMPLDIASFLRFEIGRLVWRTAEPFCFLAAVVLLRLVLRVLAAFYSLWWDLEVLVERISFLERLL